MNHKEFTVLESVSKSATFSTDSVDTTRDELFGCAVVTSAQASLNVSLQLEGSMDEASWFSVGSATAVTTDTATPFSMTDNAYPYLRITATFTAGSATFEVKAHTKSY